LAHNGDKVISVAQDRLRTLPSLGLTDDAADAESLLRVVSDEFHQPGRLVVGPHYHDRAGVAA